MDHGTEPSHTTGTSGAHTTGPEAKVAGPQTHRGSCHCGAVRFTALLDARSAGRCNCTTCTKTGVTTGIVKPEAFTLVRGAESLRSYEWGPKISRRFFCGTCGVHCFARGHLAEAGGDYVSVNFNCLDDVELSEVELRYWDGRHENWESGTRAAPWRIFASG